MADNKGAIHRRYEWINDIRLNGNKSAPLVNFFEYSIIRDGDKITYTNSWVNDIRVTDDNVAKLVKACRAKWKIENENFNTLKNLGYHAEHNFGHGKKNYIIQFFPIHPAGFFYASKHRTQRSFVPNSKGQIQCEKRVLEPVALYNPCHNIRKLGVIASFCDPPANRYSCRMKIWFVRSTNGYDSSRPFQVNGSLLASIRFS